MKKRIEQRLKAKSLSLPDRFVCHENPRGDASLHAAARMGHVEAANVLLDCGADVEQRGGWDGGTPLITAASGGHLEMVRLLLKHGADVHTTNSGGETALYWARLMNKNPELVAYLQEASDRKDRGERPEHP